jgi:hypothetical protein
MISDFLDIDNFYPAA